MNPISDIVLLQDLSGSYSDDLPQLQSLIPTTVNRLTNPNLEVIFGRDLSFGISSFKDKPISPLGGAGDYVYRQEVALTTDIELVKETVNNFVAIGGNDFPESQLEALLQISLDDSLGYREGSSRIVLLATDATFHVAGDRAAVDPTNTVLNNGNGVIDPFEDYPEIDQVRSALEDNNVIPVFLVTENVESTYEDLVDSLGRGAVIDLDVDSENISDVLKQGIAVARGVVTDTATLNDDGTSDPVFGDNSRDVIFGSSADDIINARGGSDYLDGAGSSDFLLAGGGRDTVDGGSGDDLLFGGNASDTLIGSSGNDTLNGEGGRDNLQGDSGDDILNGGAGRDTFVFDTGFAFEAESLGKDIIADFQKADVFQLSKDTFTQTNANSSGFLLAADFAKVARDGAATRSSATIVYNRNSGDLFYNENGTAPGFGEGGVFAELQGSPNNLSANDFQIVD